MPLGQGITGIAGITGITGVLGAIPRRIEVAGHGPTWRITGDSFESVVDYAQERFDDFAPLDVDRRDRWWPRITLTLTTDPGEAVGAPTLEQLHERLLAAQAAQAAVADGDVDEDVDPAPTAVAHHAPDDPGHDPRHDRARTVRVDADAPADDSPLSTLAAIFADQAGEARAPRLPRQRRGASHRG